MVALMLTLVLSIPQQPCEPNGRLRTRLVEMPRKHKREERLYTLLFDWVQE